MLAKTLQTFLISRLQPLSLSVSSFRRPTGLSMFGTMSGQGIRKPSPKKEYKNDRPKIDQGRQHINKSFSPSYKRTPKKYSVSKTPSSVSPLDENRSFEEDIPNSSAIPFDRFTRDLFNKSKEEIVEIIKTSPTSEREEAREKSEFDDIPWNFNSKVEKQEIGNLKAPIGMEKLTGEGVLVKLAEDYIKCLEENNIEKLKDLLEPEFWKKCSKGFEELKNKGWNFLIERAESTETRVELVNVTNLFCVGVHLNRKKNKSENAYFIFDKEIEGNPTTHIIKRHVDGDEMAVAKIVLDLVIEAPMKMKVVNSEGEVVAEEKGEGKRYHHMRIENDVMEVLYKSLKRVVRDEGDLQVGSMKSFKHVFSPETWKIIDFDNYMDGNNIVKPRQKLY